MVFLSSNTQRCVILLLAVTRVAGHQRAVSAQQVQLQLAENERLSADGHTLYQLRTDSRTWNDANAIAGSLVRDGCLGTGHLVKISNIEADKLAYSLCDEKDCWIGLSNLPDAGSASWKWSKDGEIFDPVDPNTYNGFGPSEPIGDNGNCVHYVLPTLGDTWKAASCSYWELPYVVEFDCTPTAPRGLAANLDWSVAFDHVTATFDDSQAPEVVLVYNASAPNGLSKYYKQQVLHPDCMTEATGDDRVVVYPTETGPIPDENYADGFLTTKIDINTTSIESSTIFWTNGTAPGLGKIEFCAKVDLFNENGNGIATESTKITLEVNNTESFEVQGNFVLGAV